jgi:NitT/TauT family transport system permease protein
MKSDRILPLFVFLTLLAGWEGIVRGLGIAPYILPAPSLILSTLAEDWTILSASLWVTLRITAAALVLATMIGFAIAILFAQFRWLERSFLPVAVILQVTPIIAIAPLLLVYLEPGSAVLACAFLVAFFPVLANTALGLGSADPNLRDLFTLYGASAWQQMRFLRLPSALPYFLGGLRIAGGLALIGAIAAEIAAGAAGQGAGLAYRIVEAGYRLNIPRMFASLALISVAGIAIYSTLEFISQRALRRWTEASRPKGQASAFTDI